MMRKFKTLWLPDSLLGNRIRDSGVLSGRRDKIPGRAGPIVMRYELTSARGTHAPVQEIEPIRKARR